MHCTVLLHTPYFNIHPISTPRALSHPWHVALQELPAAGAASVGTGFGEHASGEGAGGKLPERKQPNALMHERSEREREREKARKK